MRKPLEISGDELDAWAARVDADAILPALVRRLLFATTSRVSVDMRADGGTRLGGWDGIVETREGTPFCPAGTSVWELSVKKAVRRKLDKDFESRVMAQPSTLPLRRTTYVAVTARRFARKEQWAKEKRAQHRWADVRLYDADDLATWLEQAPAVAFWFAQKLGHPTEGVRDVESWLSSWSHRTSPPLPWRLVLAGPERAQEQAGNLLEWVSRPLERTLPIATERFEIPESIERRALLVRGETRDEARLFVSATLATHRDAEAWSSRTVIVESAEACRWALAAQRARPLLVLSFFDEVDPGQAAGGGAYLIIAGDRGTPPLRNATLDLEPMPWPELITLVEAAGFERPKAERLIQDAGGSLGKLQALCGYVELPEWAKGFPAPELLAFLLAGAWVPNNEADRAALKRLGGEPDAVEQLCVELQRRGRDVARGGDGWGPSGWYWQSPRAAWQLLADRLTDSHVERFHEVVLDVLGALDPVYDLPVTKRMFASITGHVLSHSDALRGGLAQSMVMLALAESVQPTFVVREKGSSVVSGLVYRLLAPERGWKCWASLSGLLPTLAEAAPDAFLDSLERSLDQGAQGVARLLDEEGGSSGPTPHVDLLWALEALGWSPDLSMVRRVVMALTRLGAHDFAIWETEKRQPETGSLVQAARRTRVVNRPMGSLGKILHLFSPQSRTSVGDRISMLRSLMDDERVASAGWQAGLGIVGMHGGGMLLPSHQPKYRWEPTERLRESAPEEVEQQTAGVMDLLLKYAGVDVGRWTDFLSLVRGLPLAQAQRVLDALEQASGKIVDSSARLWTALREETRWHHEHGQQANSAVRDRLESLYEKLTPKDSIQRHAWLFKPQLMRLPRPVDGGWEEEQKILADRRRLAVEELWGAPERWNLLLALAAAVEAPALIGRALAESRLAAEAEQCFLTGPPRDLPPRVASVFFGRRFEILPESDRSLWIEKIFHELLQEGRLEEVRQIALDLPNTAPVWDVLDAVGEPLRGEYWRTAGSPYGQHAAESWERAVQSFLAADNIGSAVEAAGAAGAALSVKTVLRVLERARAIPPAERRTALHSLSGFSLEQLLVRINQESSVDEATRRRFDLAFMGDVNNPARMQRWLSQALGEDPHAFVELIQAMYRPEGEPPPETDSEEGARRRASAEMAYEVLSEWKSWPGRDLPPEQREGVLEEWATKVLDATRAAGRGGPGTTHVAEVLARAPDGLDGSWPCLAARRLLKSGRYPDLLDPLYIAQRNRRGVTARGLLEGGIQERELATAFRETAEALAEEFPQTAVLLNKLARFYQDEARSEDVTAGRHRIEYGDSDDAVTAPSGVPSSPSKTTGAPLSRLDIQGVGPAPRLTLDLGSRLNLFTGDNSLGKTFVLEVLWWCLTGSFTPPEQIQMPRPAVKMRHGKVLKNKASISATAGDQTLTGTYSAYRQRWVTPGGGPLAPGLAIYARVDGGISVWDPIRCIRPQDPSEVDLSKGYHFSQQSLWEGYMNGGTTPLCNGFINDAVRWRSERPGAFHLLEKALAKLSPPGETIQFGLPKRLHVREDARPYPLLQLPYGPVFAVHASAAVQRILGLAYALVWAVSEIREAAPIAGQEPLEHVTMLIDEVEAHLHPKWQRTILRALLKVVDDIVPQATVQLFVTTHAPLVLASIERRFRKKTDAHFEFDLGPASAEYNGAARVPVIKKEPWRIRGDVNAWLESDVFHRTEVYSKEAEKALEHAKEALDDASTTKERAREIHQELLKSLSPLDPYLMRWRYMAEKRGWLS